VPGCRFVVGAERNLQVLVVGDVLDLVETVPQPQLIKAVVDEVGSARIAIGAQGIDQVTVGGDVLQAIEGAHTLLVEALGQVMQFAGLGVGTDGAAQIVVGGDVGQGIEGLRWCVVVDHQIADLVERLGMKIRLTLHYRQVLPPGAPARTVRVDLQQPVLATACGYDPHECRQEGLVAVEARDDGIELQAA
jgi:hypothetical protein